jgi:hypothetical protein
MNFEKAAPIAAFFRCGLKKHVLAADEKGDRAPAIG